MHLLSFNDSRGKNVTVNILNLFPSVKSIGNIIKNSTEENNRENYVICSERYVIYSERYIIYSKNYIIWKSYVIYSKFNEKIT